MDVANMPKIVPMEEREWFVLFAICVAGKSAKQTEKKLNKYLYTRGQDISPFCVVKCDISCLTLAHELRHVKIGQYTRIEKAFREVIKLDITKDLTVEKLEAIPGIGPKTARFIVLYTDPTANCAVLDTHILKFLKEKYGKFEAQGGIKIPKSTPPAGPKYRALEKLFQTEAELEGISVRELDTQVWQSYAGK